MFRLIEIKMSEDALDETFKFKFYQVYFGVSEIRATRYANLIKINSIELKNDNKRVHAAETRQSHHGWSMSGGGDYRSST